MKKKPLSLLAALILCAGGMLAIGAHAEKTDLLTHQIETRLQIQAPAERVWATLLDFPKHPEWNPFIRYIEGQALVGEKLQVRVQPEGGNEVGFSPTVLVVKPQEELRWQGRFILPGLFDGEHYFLLRSDGAGGVSWVHGEKFSGLLVPFLKGSLETGTRVGFEAMNEALRKIVEQR